MVLTEAALINSTGSQKHSRTIDLIQDDNNSISDNFIRDIYEDSKGRLWVATDFGGLNLFDRETETFYRIQNDPDNPNSLPINSLRAVAEDKFGNLWIGSFGGGLSKLVLNPEDKKKERKEVFDKGGEIFTNYQHDPSDLNSLMIESTPLYCAIQSTVPARPNLLLQSLVSRPLIRSMLASNGSILLK